MISNAGLIVRSVESGIAIFYNDAQLDVIQAYVKNRSEPLLLGFSLFVDDASFSSYTEPTTYRDNEILYFDNSRVTLLPDGMLSLHQERFVAAEDFRKLKKSKHAKGVKSLSNARKRFRFYRLNTPLWTDLIAERGRQDRPLAVINMTLSQSESQGSMFDTGLRPQPRNYLLSFAAKTSFWKYYVMGDYRAEELNVSDPDQEIEFEYSGEELLSDSRRAITFTSKQPVPMQKWPELRLQLKRAGRNGGDVLVKHLPVASVNSSNRDVVEGNDVVVSEIYVNC